jgi:cell division protein FtsW (lipid II flippase)
MLRRWGHQLPWSLLLAVALIGALGWLGVDRGEQIAGGSGRLARQQAGWLVLGGVTVWGACLLSYRRMARWAYPVFGFTLLLLTIVYAFPPINGAHRWIRMAGMSLQPSEFAKIAFVLSLARYAIYREHFHGVVGLLTPLALALAPLLLILREPDLGTSLVFLPVLVAMLFAAGARLVDLGALALCGLLVAPLLWSQMSVEQRSRVSSLFEQTGPGQKPSPDGYQLHQAKQLLALGGITGTRLRDDTLDGIGGYHLPEAHTDFIFTCIGERFGWAGLGAILASYAILISSGLQVAERTDDPFGRLVAVGISSLFAVEALINTGMTVGLLPVTGLSLPLVSYGGSGLLAHALGIGLVVNIALRSGRDVGPHPWREKRAWREKRTPPYPALTTYRRGRGVIRRSIA